jgi:hypothetical protein
MPRRRLIPVERKDLPVFVNEDEEHAFWSTHEMGPGMLSELRPDGDPELPSPEEVRRYLDERRPRTERTQPVPIRFEVDLLRRLRALAARKHIGYQTLLKQFVAERVYEEEQREGLLVPRRAP